MSIAGPRMIKEVRECVEFVIKNLNEQYVIPHYAKGYYEAMYKYDDNVNSKLAVSITVKNVSVSHDKDSAMIDNIGALNILAKVSVEDELENDSWGNNRVGFDFLAFFGIVSSSYTESKEVVICDNVFEVTVTYTRSYEQINGTTHNSV